MRQKAPRFRRGSEGRSLAPIALTGTDPLARNSAGRAGTLRRWAAVLHHGRISFLLRQRRKAPELGDKSRQRNRKAQGGADSPLRQAA
ncbi:hypothetical protein SFOMI_3915 [Sphingobium fuliginis]|uniref:Uncharacterized protein n=1 Tax=Sphingobium fuliginis (strain ATCC 27551) TaxID=336203 RepID=A0A292ZJT0_SPHSA|nr:hypothetical protein SFOMI_3915 [Sphingobium fuliginis]